MCISAVCDWLVFIVLENDVLQQAVWNILHNVPLDRETTSPLVLLPMLYCFVKINMTDHLSKANKLATCIHLQKENIITSIRP
jgi:hypothetical protein